jgi:Protein of unknown function (DUF3060)
MVQLHRSSLACLASAFLASAWGVGAAHAQMALVTQSGGSVTAYCGGGDARVDGSGTLINFQDECRSLTVNGTGNNIEVHLIPGGIITLNGGSNSVVYAPVGGTLGATIVEHAHGNRIERLAARPGGMAIITNGAPQR